MEMKPGNMYKVTLAYSMNDKLHPFPMTLIGQCLMTNDKYITLLDPQTNIVKGFKKSQMSTSEPYDPTNASDKPETKRSTILSGLLGKSSPGTTSLFSRMIRPISSLVGTGATAGTTAGTTAGPGDPTKQELAVLQTKLKTKLEIALNSSNKFDDDLNTDLTEYHEKNTYCSSVSSKHPCLIPILPNKKPIPFLNSENMVNLKENIRNLYTGENSYLLSKSEFIPYQENIKLPNPVFVFHSIINVANRKW